MIVLEIGVDLKDVRAGINPERKKENRAMMGKYHSHEKETHVRFRRRNFVQFLIYACDFREIDNDR
jgi:hypothetical protein